MVGLPNGGSGTYSATPAYDPVAQLRATDDYKDMPMATIMDSSMTDVSVDEGEFVRMFDTDLTESIGAPMYDRISDDREIFAK